MSTDLTQSTPLTVYRSDLFRLTCPHPMQSLDLMLTLFYLGGASANVLRNNQRIAWAEMRRQIQEETWDKPQQEGESPPPVFGAYAHHLLGLQPPWPVIHGVSQLPDVFKAMVNRYTISWSAASTILLNDVVGRLFQEKGLDQNINCYTVWSRFVRNENLNRENVEYRAFVAEYEILSLVMMGGLPAAQDVAERLYTAIVENNL